MPEYIILWKPIERTRADLGARKIGGRAPENQAAGRLTRQVMDEAEAAEAALSPEIHTLSRSMRTKLVQPLAESADDNEPAWGIEAVGATQSAFTGGGIKVAVLDTGIERAHSAFAGVNIQEKDFTGDGDGDADGHGTHCAATIFGRDVDGKRIGIAREVNNVIIGKVLGNDGGGTSQMIFDGLLWAIRERAQIISLSLGFDFAGEVAEKVRDGWPADLATSDALRTFHQNLSMFQAILDQASASRAFGGQPLIVAAAGNDSRREIDATYRISASLPAAICDVAVGALRRDGAQFSVAEFSNSNPTLSAPGANILSAALGGGLKALSGTSMACPHVAGVASLWAEKVRKDGDEVSGAVLSSHLQASARKDAIARFAVIDVGRGLVQAP